MQTLFANIFNFEWQMAVMWAVGALLIYLAIVKEMEPSLLLPMGFRNNTRKSSAFRRCYTGNDGGTAYRAF